MEESGGFIMHLGGKGRGAKGDIFGGELMPASWQHRWHGVVDTRKVLKVREAKDNIDIGQWRKE